MKFVFASYVFTKEFNDPELWLKRIDLYAGIQSKLSANNEVISIEQIDYEGNCISDGVQYQFLKLSKFERWVPLKLHRYILSLKTGCCGHSRPAFSIAGNPVGVIKK